MNKAIVMDLDGTIANLDHRVQYVRQKPKSYLKFNKLMPDDTVNEWCKELMFNYALTHYVLICTCREEMHREVTEKWLEDNNIPYDQLIMRPSKSGHGRDGFHKKKMYNTHIKGVYEVEFVVDDRDSAVKAWRKLGLTCLQCAYGDF